MLELSLKPDDLAKRVEIKIQSQNRKSDNQIRNKNTDSERKS